MRSSFSHHALSPEPLCVLRWIHPEPSGNEEVVCVCVFVCIHACVLVFASASGYVLLCVCVCLCGTADGEQLREGKPDI